MARLLFYSFFLREVCFFLTLGLVVLCVTGLPAGRETTRTESTTSDSSADSSSDDPSSLWDVFDGLDIDGNPWLSQSSPPSAAAKSKRRVSSTFGNDDYDYDDYDDNLLEDEDGESEEDGGNMFLSFPRKAMNFKEKDDDSESDEDEKSTLKQNARYNYDFGSKDDENLITKKKTLGPVSVVEDEGSEEDVIFATNDDEEEEDDEDDDDNSEVSVPAEKKGAVHQMDDDSEDQTFGEPEIEGVETFYNDHIFLF